MQTIFSLLLSAFAFGLALGSVLSTTAFAQQSSDQNLDRLRYRYQINDNDGLGELIEPLWQHLIQGVAEFNLPQQHLIAMAAMKFYSRTGQYDLAILPGLVAVQKQQAMQKVSATPWVEPIDARYRKQHLPPVFFTEQDRQRFRSQLNTAIVQGVLNESELVVKYREPTPDKLDKVQNEMLASITAATANDPPSDREILRLIQSYVTHQDQHRALAHESLAIAIEALQRLKRKDEAERLAAVFRTQFPDSRRLQR